MERASVIRKPFNPWAALAAAVLLSAGAAPALAEKPDWAGKGGKHKHESQHGRGEARAPRDARVGGFFEERDRQLARAYYGERYGHAKGCPPGLAKKNNGCLPPGQAKKYRLGEPLPAGVVLYPVPQRVMVQLPPAPAGHKYVRVAADILLIAVGTSMVVDAITDLTRL